MLPGIIACFFLCRLSQRVSESLWYLSDLGRKFQCSCQGGLGGAVVAAGLSSPSPTSIAYQGLADLSLSRLFLFSGCSSSSSSLGWHQLCIGVRCKEKTRPIMCGEGEKKRLNLKNGGRSSGGIVKTEGYIGMQVEKSQCRPSGLSIHPFFFSSFKTAVYLSLSSYCCFFFYHFTTWLLFFGFLYDILNGFLWGSVLTIPQVYHF